MRQIILVLFLISGLLFGQDSVTISDLPATATLSDNYVFETESPSTSYKVTWLNMRNEMVNDLNLGLWARNGLNIYYNTGNVGIGTGSPQSKFHLYKGSSGATGLTIYDAIIEDATASSLAFVGTTFGSLIYHTGSNAVGSLIFNLSSSTFIFNTTIPNVMNILNNGNVGINDNTPSYKLDVNGSINFTDTLFKNGSPFVGGLWTLSGSNIYYNGGNVGINDATPSYKLDVGGEVASDGIYHLGTVSTEAVYVADAGGGRMAQFFYDSDFYAADSGITGFSVYESDGIGQIVLNPSGSFGIGTNYPVERLTVEWTAGVDAGFFRGTTDPDITGTFSRSPDGTKWFQWINDGGVVQTSTTKP